MNYKRETDKLWYMKIYNKGKRTWAEMAILSVMGILALFFLPQNTKEAEEAGSVLNLLALFVVKTNATVWGLLIVDFVRKWKWPYMDLQTMIEKNQWAGVLFLAIIYAAVVHALAMGG